jgi:hypothetical protein
MTRAAMFKLSDVRRAIKATEACGLSVAGVEVSPDGTIRVLARSENMLTGVSAPAPDLSPFEAWEAVHGLRAA